MRIAVALPAIALAVLSTSALADENWAEHMTVSATTSPGAGSSLRVVIEGREGWYVNTAYPGLKITVNPADGVTVAKAELGKDDVKFEGEAKEGKSKRAVFTVPVQGAAKPVEGAYKVVICSEKSCSPPIKGTFKTTAGK